MGLLKSLKTFRYMLSRNPVRALEILQLRIEKKIGLSLHPLTQRRRATRALEMKNTKPVDDRLTMFGNYYLVDELLGDAPVVISAGVGCDIRFDRALVERGIKSLHLIDPTPSSKVYVDGQDLPKNVTFDPYAVGDFDGELELYIDDLEEDIETASSVSIKDAGYSGIALTAPCRRISTIMKQYGHDRLDVLKLDVEGAAIAVLSDCFANKLYPRQIAAEFERPDSDEEVSQYLAKMEQLLGQLKAAGYEIFRTRPDCKGCQVEIVAVRFD